jgi:hypothetical protein
MSPRVFTRAVSNLFKKGNHPEKKPGITWRDQPQYPHEWDYPGPWHWKWPVPWPYADPWHVPPRFPKRMPHYRFPENQPPQWFPQPVYA